MYFDDRAYFWSYGPLNTKNISVISVIYLFPICNLKTICDIFLKLNLLTELWHLLNVSAVVGHGEMSAALLLDI